MAYQENLKGSMEKGNNRATGKRVPRLHTMTKLTNLTMNKLTTIMKPPGQNRVSTMKETLTEPSQL